MSGEDLAGLDTSVNFDISGFEDLEFMQDVNEIINDTLDPRWSIGVGGSVHTSPEVDSGMIYFGACDKTFYALSLNGKKVWEFGTGDINIAPACIVGSLVVFGSYDTNLYALDKKTGRFVWKFGTGGKIITRPCTDGERIFLGSEDGNIYCLDMKGRFVWKFGTGGPISGFPILHKGRIYVGSNDGNLYSIDRLTGGLVWRFGTKSYIRGNMAVLDDVIYFTGMDKTAYGVTTSGRQVFSFHMKDVGSSESIKIADGVLYIPSRDSCIYAVRPDGRFLWTFKTENGMGGPVIYDDAVYFGSGDHNIYAVDARKGSLKWRYTTQGPIWSRPTIHGDMLFVGCWDCNLYALDARNGKLIWKFRTKLSNQSQFRMEEIRPHDSLQVILKNEKIEEDSDKYKENTITMNEYSVIHSSYTSGMSKSYVKGRKGYI